MAITTRLTTFGVSKLVGPPQSLRWWGLPERGRLRCYVVARARIQGPRWFLPVPRTTHSLPAREPPSEIPVESLSMRSKLSRMLPAIVRGADGPLLTPEAVLMAPIPLLPTGTDANVVFRGVSPNVLAIRSNVKIIDGACSSTVCRKSSSAESSGIFTLAFCRRRFPTDRAGTCAHR